ncbi:deoxyribose-phosphate aldolase [Vampirovibrio sp.]|uniref:deoxyribose-phosphate aldolase n=1 Tax=Vampirovibrio sp. TaxID=2717857 RepID=UPI003593A7BA
MSAAVTEIESSPASQLARTIDHTKLTFAVGEDEQAAILQLCEEARQYGFFAVCVRPRHVALCKKHLMDTAVKVATVIGFPLDTVKLEAEKIQPTIGNFPIADKVAEARQAVLDGADELDVVIHVAQLKSDTQTGATEVVRQELKAIQEAASGKPIKVIIETDLLSDAEIMQISHWCAELRVLMVKTCTGMVEGGQGATVKVVSLIQSTLRKTNPKTKIKASGGIKSQEQAQSLLKAGAVRLGTSSGLAIVQGSSAENAVDY